MRSLEPVYALHGESIIKSSLSMSSVKNSDFFLALQASLIMKNMSVCPDLRVKKGLNKAISDSVLVV